MSDWYWHVPADTWPSFDINPEELMDLLDEFEKYWPGAVASLAETVVPGEVDTNV